MSHYGNDTLPAGWAWTTIGELLCNRDEERIPVSSAVRKKQANKIYDYYGAAGVIDKVDSYLFDERLLLIGEDGANLLSRAKDNAFFAEGKYWVNNHAHILDCTNKLILDYVAFVINAMDLKPYISGSAQPKLNQENLNKISIPLPPLSEQKRIVGEIEWCFKQINTIENYKEDLHNLVSRAKSKILDLAISGKLVPQDPTDEPATDLLRRINPAIKPCDNPHYPFEIHDTWQLCTIGDLFKHNTGKALNASNQGGTPFRYITTSNLYWDRFELSEIRQMPFTDSEKEKCQVQKGDLLVCEGGDVGRAAIWMSDDPIMIQNHIHKLRPKAGICTRFYLYIFMLYKCKGMIGGKGIGILGLSAKELDRMVVPVPPIMEQYRIVNKIDSLFTMLSEIKDVVDD